MLQEDNMRKFSEITRRLYLGACIPKSNFENLAFMILLTKLPWELYPGCAVSSVIQVALVMKTAQAPAKRSKVHPDVKAVLP